MTGPAWLAWHYLLHYRTKTTILVVSIALIVFLPAGLRVLVDQSSRALRGRADATPLVLGARGSSLDLVLSALYFEAQPPDPIAWRELERLRETALAEPLPLLLGFRARGWPIVGTTLDYLDHRGLRVAEGRSMALLGEAVIGARVARALDLSPGDVLISSPETLFDIAGTYPLAMHVVGVLATSDSPDDGAVFVDVKTAWVIAGLGHGHRNLADAGTDGDVAAREDAVVTARASVVEYNEITPDNEASFHFHGDLSAFPLSAIALVPPDARARALLLGRYQSSDETVQIVRPDVVMDELLETVVTVERHAMAAIAVVGAATAATAGLVFLLSIRLRKREIDTLHKIGVSRPRVLAVLLSEVAVVTTLGIVLAGLLTLLLSHFGEAALRRFLLL